MKFILILFGGFPSIILVQVFGVSVTAIDKKNTGIESYYSSRVNISFPVIFYHEGLALGGHSSFIHRFFDSSAISPSGKYIAVWAHKSPEDQSSIGKLAEVAVSTLSEDGPNRFNTTVVASTKAWDAQVGAHVQWGADDSILLYNTIMPLSYKPITHKDFGAPRGVLHNLTSGETKLLECPIYHVSLDGKFAISPNLMKIAFTQYGYGVRSASAERNLNAPIDDGFYLTDLSTGKCQLLLSLRDLAIAGKLDVTSTPTYGFHAKWSSDGEMLLRRPLLLRRIRLSTSLTQLIACYAMLLRTHRTR